MDDLAPDERSEGRVSRLRASDDGVVVDVDGTPRSLSWTWLRDHADDEGSYHTGANQRLVPSSVVAAASSARVAIEPAGRALVATWPGGPTAHFPADLLATVGTPEEMYGSVGPEPVPWIAAELSPRLERVGFDEVTRGDAGLRRTLHAIARDGLAMVDDVPTDVTGTRAVLERFGYVRTTIFGDVWVFGSDGALDDTASTSLEITPHTDGTYSNDAPGLLALHCHRFDATGGENLLVDGRSIAAQLTRADPDAAELLRIVEIPGRYVGDGAHLIARRPVLRHEHGRLVQVSYNHHDRAPFLLPEPTMRRLYEALHRFDSLAQRPENGFELALRPGAMVLIDNWRVLHGRRAFAGDRDMAGGYLNREDVESTMRLLGL